MRRREILALAAGTLMITTGCDAKGQSAPERSVMTSAAPELSVRPLAYQTKPSIARAAVNGEASRRYGEARMQLAYEQTVAWLRAVSYDPDRLFPGAKKLTLADFGVPRLSLELLADWVQSVNAALDGDREQAEAVKVITLYGLSTEYRPPADGPLVVDELLLGGTVLVDNELHYPKILVRYLANLRLVLGGQKVLLPVSKTVTINLDPDGAGWRISGYDGTWNLSTWEYER